jgi:DNA-binding NarL/FixJ family response regulator
MTTQRKIRILIADDHQVVRMGLVALISTASDLEVVGEAADGDQAIALFDQHSPDVVLMDSRMPAKDGIAATSEILRRFPEARILMLTAYDGDADIRRALNVGVRGYVLKRSTGENLLPALRAVAKGEHWMPKDVSTRLASRKSFENLTSRETQVLEEMAQGLANKQIADALGITEHTVKDHVKNILAKLRVADRTEAVAVAVQRGILHLQE